MLSNRDYINIGSAPSDEPCAQVGAPAYYEQSIKECEAFKHQLERMFPDGEFSTKSFPHEFGTYRDVIAWFYTIHDEEMTEQQKKASDAAFQAEAETPEFWDEQAKKELGL